MEPFLGSAQSFASMEGNVDEGFFFQCAREYALTLVSMVVEKYGTGCADDVSLFSSVMELPPSTAHMPFWCPELGQCLATLTSGKVAVARRALTQLAVNALEAGVPGRWESDFAEPVRLRWGHLLLPEALRLEAESDGAEGRVRIRGLGGEARDLRFLVRGGGESEAREAGAEPLPYLELGRRKVLLLSGPHCEQFGLPGPVLPGVEAVTEEHLRTFSAPLALFEEHFPGWVPWIERVLRAITLSEPAPAGIHSGTVEGYYGSIWISASDDSLKIAESLLHEASHQYFFLLNRLGALTNDDGRRFYSPFVQRERPPDKLLLAYHAFTNVEMFYTECLRRGIKAAQCRLVLAQLKQELGCVQRSLSTEIDLTPVGRCIFDSLLTYRSAYGATN